MSTIVGAGPRLLIARWGDQDNGFEPEAQIIHIDDDQDEVVVPDAPLRQALSLTPAGDSVFWSSFNGATLSGPEAEEQLFIPDPGAWLGVATTDDALFWGGKGGLRRLEDNASDFEIVADHGLTGAVALSDDWLLTLDIEALDGLQVLYRARLDGSDSSVVMDGKLYPHLVADEQFGFIRTNATFDDPEVDLMRVPASGGDAETMLTAPLLGEFDLRDGWLYGYTEALGFVRVPAAP